MTKMKLGALLICAMQLCLFLPFHIGPIHIAHAAATGKIAYVSGDTFSKELYVVDADGKNSRRLASTLDDTYCPRWAPDGQTILFTGRGEVTGEVYMIDVEGKNPRRLTNAGDDHPLNHGPAFSPDGKLIAFADSPDNQGLYVMDSDGGNVRQLLEEDTTFLAWSPGSQTIAFVSLDGGLNSIDSDGKNKRRLIDDATTSVFFAWSPDGKRIAFVGLSSDGGEYLFVVDADGKNQRSISDKVYSTETLSWSPDGKQIAFVSDRNGHRELYTIDADGKNVRRLTKTSDDIWNVSPAYSPDGKQIAYVLVKNNKKDIYLMDADGKNNHPLTQGGSNTCPSWQQQTVKP